MTTQQQAQGLRAALADVLTLFISGLLSQWRTLPLDDVAKTRRLLVAALPGLLDTFGRSSSAVAADWYATTRDDQRVPGLFMPDPVLPDVEAYIAKRLDSAVNWATTPLAAPTPDLQQALERLVDTAQTEVLLPARDTVLRATVADPGHPRYARVAQPGACAFCSLLASRGAVYYELTAGFQTHNACRCVPVPSWDAAPYEPSPEVAAFQAAYRSAKRATDGSTKAVLAHMRTTLGVR